MKRLKNCTWILCFVGLSFLAGACSKKSASPRVLVSVTGGNASAVFINGYQNSMEGKVLSYHSSHPDADSALLARANREAASITWATDPLPSTIEGDFYQLVWLAGLECAGWPGEEAHEFDFFINGDQWFTFKNLKDAGASRWSVGGRQGAELSFEATMTDRAGDLFGYMFLRVPKSAVPPGAPLQLQVKGRDAGSLDWYMTLQYTFRFRPSLRAEPALIREGIGRKQLIRLSLDNLQRDRTIQVSVEGSQPVHQPLKIGANIFYLPVSAADSERQLPVDFMVDGRIVKTESLNVPPVRPRELYLLSYSHNDIGYTDLQPAIEKKQRDNLELGLRLIRQTRDYPRDARFKWNLEVMWPLEGYLANASGQKRREVLDAVREGSLGLNALYANVLTGLANSTEMSHFTEYAGRFAEQNSCAITTALVSDIPGFTWGIVPALAHSGVKYFASAPNSGDRIGHVLEEWGDKPFYWTSQSGEERVLMWVAGASYSSFHEGDVTRLGDEKILKLTRRLQENRYPYEIFQLPYTIGGDNGPPDPHLPDFVKSWNERYVSPRLIIATHAQMFAEFERRYGSSLPSFSGDLTPYWEDGAASTAFETGLNRRTADRLIQGEALWAVRAPASYPDQDYYSAWRDVLLWDEHTWGAHNSVSDPDLPSVRAQWKIKRQFALDADRRSRELMERLSQPPAAYLQEDIPWDIHNTNSWPRTDLVLLTPAQSRSGDQVVDSQGNPVPAQRLSTGELAVLVKNVPPFSAQRIFVKPGTAKGAGSCKATQDTLSNSLLALSLDPQQGVIGSLKWLAKNIELVDKTKAPGLNQYLYVAGKNPGDARPLSNIGIKVKESGKLVSSLLVEAAAPGSRRYSAEYRIIDGVPRIDIIQQLDKQAVRAKEAIHIAFPFHVPGGLLRYDVANGIVRPETDQLPGSCKNFFSLQSWADVSNPEYGVTWTSADAPLIEIGTIMAEQPWARTTSSSSTIYSYLMNNYWHTNYKADQEGPAVFRFSILPHGSFRPEEAVRAGREAREALVALPGDRGSKPPSSLFRVVPPEVLVSSLKPLPGGRSLLLCLYNPTGKEQQVSLDWYAPSRALLYSSDSLGRAGARINGAARVAAQGSRYVRIEVDTGIR